MICIFLASPAPMENALEYVLRETSVAPIILPPPTSISVLAAAPLNPTAMREKSMFPPTAKSPVTTRLLVICVVGRPICDG